MSNTINDGGPAFPTQNGCRNDEGMTLRDWFAGMALQGIINNDNAFANMSDRDIAENCWTAADAMLAARERKEDA